MSLDAQVAQALELAGWVVPVDAVREAWAGRADRPAHVLVIGRRSAGKSALVNALVGAEAEVGLGGVTREARAWSGEDLVLIDTVGLEHELDGADQLETWLPQVDAVLWLVDGLQPLTRVERRAVDRAIPLQTPLVVAVSRLDLVDGSEHEAILDRVRLLLAERKPFRILSNRELDAIRDALGHIDPMRSPRRVRVQRAAWAGLAQALAHLAAAAGPNPEDLTLEASTLWRDGVRHAQDEVLEQVDRSELLFRDEALQGLHTRLLSVADEVRTHLRRELGEASGWRPTPPAELDLRGQMADLWGGAKQVREGLQRGADRWIEEGVAAIESTLELPISRMQIERREAVARARGAVADVLAALPVGLDPDR